jgi:glutamyl-tRNA synthetase
MTERAVFAADILAEGHFFFTDEVEYDRKAIDKKWKPESTLHLQQLQEKFSKLPSFDADSLEAAFKETLTENSIGFGQLGPVLRIALTGGLTGPSVFEIASLLGKERSLARIQHSLTQLA